MTLCARLSLNNVALFVPIPDCHDALGMEGPLRAAQQGSALPCTALAFIGYALRLDIPLPLFEKSLVKIAGKILTASCFVACLVAGCGGGGGGDGQSTGGNANGGAPPGGGGGGPSLAGFPVAPSSLFTQPHAWNRDVSALAASARSPAIIGALNTLGGWGAGSMRIDFSIALLFADTGTPRRTITAAPGGYCFGGNDCDAVPLQVPIPTNGNTEGSSNYVCDTANNDCHVLVVETTSRKLYELYNATQAGAAFTALGAFVWDLTKQYPDSLRGEQCTSADAAGLPMSALLATSDEVSNGDISHALRFILPNARMKRQVYVRPATHAGGPSSTNADAPPYGVRFRLKAGFDETQFNAGERVVLHAMKKYGMILSDGGNIALTFADDRLSSNKWAALGIDSFSFSTVAVSDFEVVDLGSEIALTFNCVRNP